jgi:hypothetical protein
MSLPSSRCAVAILVDPAGGEEAVTAAGEEEAVPVVAAAEPCRIWRHAVEVLFAGERSRRPTTMCREEPAVVAARR